MNESTETLCLVFSTQRVTLKSVKIMEEEPPKHDPKQDPGVRGSCCWHQFLDFARFYETFWSAGTLSSRSVVLARLARAPNYRPVPLAS